MARASLPPSRGARVRLTSLNERNMMAQKTKYETARAQEQDLAADIADLALAGVQAPDSLVDSYAAAKSATSMALVEMADRLSTRMEATR